MRHPLAGRHQAYFIGTKLTFKLGFGQIEP